ncbi:MAG: trypsin-like peptidase domain-containing protein [Actinomycetota bacterium]|nr:trypsin-like peptidase domain-containing protein [Actinomycetota bacterium]
MTESDETRNAEDRDPTEQAPVQPLEPWPQYTWPPTAEDGPDATPPAAAVPTPDPVWASWPPTQQNPTAATPTAAAGDPTAPVPNAGYGGAWSPPPPAWGPAGPSGWSPIPPAPRPASNPRRGLAVLAALALVLASAGVGAGVAIAVHNNSNTRTFDASGAISNNPNSPNNLPSGNSGNGGSNLPGGGNVGTSPPGTGSLDVSAIEAKVDPALVNINTTLAQGRAAGSGMLISSTGEVLTNNHVIADATSIKVVIGGTGPSHDAKVVGYDVTEDVALLQIVDKVSNLPTVTFGEPSKVHIGDPVVAIGNALGRGGKPSASQGQVTALDQQVTAGDAGGSQETLEGMIQINAPIQPGDSGGALVDRSAKIIGMNTAAAGGGRFNAQTGSDIGFAIPIDNAVGIVSQIRSGTDTDKIHIGDRALLGVQVQNVDGQNAAVSSGALVVGVQDNTGASAAGMQTGDVIVSLDGKPIANSAALRLALVKFHPGESVSVGWVDSTGKRHDASVKLIIGPPL